MSTNELFERRLSHALHQALDGEALPHPLWADAPAAERISRRATRRNRWPLRLLAVAALLVVGAGAAVGGAWLLRNDVPKPLPAPLPAPTVATSLTPSLQPAAASDGWLAMSIYNGWTNDIYFVGPDGSPIQVVGSRGDTVWEDCPAFSPDGRTLMFLEENDDSSDTPDGVLAFASIAADELPVSPPARLDLGEDLSCPVWSRDGEHVLVEGPSGLHIIDPVALSDTSIAALNGTHGGGFEWGSDSQSLFYIMVPSVSGDEQQTPELWTINVNGQGNERLMTFETGTVIDALTSLAPNKLSLTSHTLQEPGDGGNTLLRFSVVELDPTKPQTEPVSIANWDSDASKVDQAPVFARTDDAFADIRASEMFVGSHSDVSRKITLAGLVWPAYVQCVIGWSAAEDSVLIVASDTPFLDRGVQTAVLEVNVDGSSTPRVVVPWGSVGSYASCHAAPQVVQGDWTFPGPGDRPRVPPGPSQSLRPTPTPTEPPVAVPATDPAEQR